MIRTFLLGNAIVIALAASSFAQDQCVAPTAPAIPDGARATPPQIVAAQNEIKVFATASDSFQACLAQEMSRQKEVATKNAAELDPSIPAALSAKGAAQRKEVEKVAAAWGATVDAFNKAQARKRQPSAGASAPSGGYGSGYGGGSRY
jgi:hypothetical protein